MPGVSSAAALVACAALAAAALTASPAHADELRDKEYWLEGYGITEAWESTRGAGVKVAVIDSGVDGTHPDLEGVVVGGTDASGAGSPNGQQGIGEVPEHGTLVASLLAGRGHEPEPEPTPSASPSGSASPSASPSASDSPSPSESPEPTYGAGPDGVIGVAPEAELLAVSVWISGETSGANPTGVSIDDQIPNAVRWAVDNGATVINMSLGSTSPTWPESWDDAFLYAEQRDVVIVAAAGNRAGGSAQVGAPATMPGILAVGGLNREGEASRESSSEGISIGVAAPAENLVGALPGGFYASQWSGTSGAAPLVSGVAALIRSKYPELTAPQVINRIILTARDAGEPGQDTIYGYGILDAEAAVNAELDVPTEPLLGAGGVVSMAEYIETYRRGAPEPPEEPAPSEPTEALPDIPEPTIPVAEERAAVSSGLPAAIVFGFAGLILFILAAGTYQVVRVRGAEAGGAPETGESVTTEEQPPDPANRPES
ncbi:S8 family serine peptidase [Arthrobacter sp. H5]|uniref:S8 family serine peptidase n=1 Tax=Arthrobacter sp. H5 TaxID=1267973 RepID=UPI00056BFF91|nr:S8 family serine peptidase [Arthrobacter sp. H5]